MRKFFLTIVSALLFLPLMAKTEKPVMTVNGYEVSKSEFAHFLENNYDCESLTKKDLKKAANLYLDFKLKVQAAIESGLDKSESFLEEFKAYRNSLAEEYMIDTVFIEEWAQAIYKDSYNEVGPEGLSFMCIITLFPKDETLNAMVTVWDRMDSIRNCIVRGEDFGELAGRYSMDSSAKNGGQVGWMSRAQLPENIGDSLFSLKPGTVSHPFVEDGVVVLVGNLGHRDFGSYEENRDDIYAWMRNKSDIYNESLINTAETYSKELGWGLDGDSAVMYMDSHLEELIPEFGNYSRDYYDGLLMFEISNQEIWEPALNDSIGLASYYESHKNEFWKDADRFKGMVFFCINEDVFHNMESMLDGVPFEQWSDSIVAHNTDFALYRVLRGSASNGVFEKGQSEYVDKLVFGEGSFEPMKNFPYTGVIGKRLSSPESISDVASQVADGYQNDLEHKWVKQLRQKYKYKINKRALYSAKP